MPESIILDLKSFIALSSRSRISILKKLDVRCMTVTELSKTENLAKSTVHEHLEKLLDAGLIGKKEGNHKWTYYEITEKGIILLHPQEKNKILVLLSFSVVSVACGFAYIAKFMKDYLRQSTYPPAEGAYDITFYLLVGLLFIVISFILSYSSLRQWGVGIEKKHF
jgi:predicted transcriptional regulator